MPSELLPPFGQWAFGESRVQKNIRVIRVIRVQKTVSAPPRTKIRVIGEIRVQDKNIRVIRVIRVQKNIECDPCAKNIFVLSALFVFKRIYKGLCPKLSTNKIYFK